MQLRLPAALMIGAVTLGSSGFAPPPGCRVVALSTEGWRVAEPSIAIDPNHPRNVVVVFESNVHAMCSRDAGATWRRASGLGRVQYRRGTGDVSATFDDGGRAFIAYVGTDKLGSFNYWGHHASAGGLFVQRSLNGGATWGRNAVVARHATGPHIPFEDKPYIVADAGHDRFAGRLYLGWTHWTLTGSAMVFSRSIDHGVTWSQPVEIDGHPGLPRDDNGEHDGFDGAVAADGTLYAAWYQDGGIALVVSRDGGETFSAPRLAIRTSPLSFNIDGINGLNGFPQVGVDPGSGRVYLTWSDYRNGDVDVFCATSDDGGASWTAPVRVNDDPLHDGAEQFLQWMAVDPQDRSVNVVFYDRRTDPDKTVQTVTLARSTDGGQTFRNYAWTTKSFDANNVFIGDYTGIAAFGGRVYGAWAERFVLRVGIADFGM